MAASSRGETVAASTGAGGGAGVPGQAEGKSYFEEQREALCGEIATSLENVLQNINKLNRSLESVIAVGNEFSSVEALWSQFENVMGCNGTAHVSGDGADESHLDGYGNGDGDAEDGEVV